MLPKINPTKVRSLSPAKGPDAKALGFHPENILRHPLLPIVIAICVGSATQDMVGLWIGFGLCALWLWLDCLPWTNILSIHWGNLRVATYQLEEDGGGKERAVARRNRIIRFTRYGLGCASFVCIGLLYWFIMQNFNERHMVQEWSDVYQNLDGQMKSVDGNNTPKGMQFTITNSSKRDIFLVDIDCEISHLQFSNGFRLDDDGNGLEFKLYVHHGGDGQSMTCPSTERLMSFEGNNWGVACGDVLWNVHYSPSDSPKEKVSVKSYRYVLSRGDSEWRKIAKDSYVPSCEQR